MTLLERMELDLTEAMRAKDEFAVTALRMLKSSVQNAAIAKRGELTDDEVAAVLAKEAKKRQEAMAEFAKAGRAELANKEEAEHELIGRYLPEKMGDEDVRAAVKQLLGEEKFTDFGQAMRAAMAGLKGKADGALVSKLVREELDKK